MTIIDDILNLPWPRIALLFLFLYFLLVLYAWFYGDKVLFPFPDPPSYLAEEVGFFLDSKNSGRIACLSVFAKEHNGLTILYSHGNGEDIGMIKPLIESLAMYGCHVITYDYPGYGLSEGSPSETNCYDAIDAVYNHLINQENIPPSKILIWGRSLGTGPSCYLASRVEVAGLLLETPFLSAFRTISEIPVLPWDRFRNIEYTQSIKCPSLIIHGRWDEVVPFRQGKKIYANLPAPKTFIEIKDASHNDLAQKGGELYKESIQDFIKKLE